MYRAAKGGGVKFLATAAEAEKFRKSGWMVTEMDTPVKAAPVPEIKAEKPKEEKKDGRP